MYKHTRKKTKSIWKEEKKVILKKKEMIKFKNANLNGSKKQYLKMKPRSQSTVTLKLTYSYCWLVLESKFHTVSSSVVNLLVTSSSIIVYFENQLNFNALLWNFKFKFTSMPRWTKSTMSPSWKILLISLMLLMRVCWLVVES